MDSTAGQRGLPQELVDIVIDHQHSDRDTLKQCSLVCRSWVPSSSLHLLRRVAWPVRPHRRQTCDYDDGILSGEPKACSCPDPADTSFRACITGLQTSDRLRLYVRTLGLSSARQRCAGSVKWEKLDVSVIASILNSLPDLKGLHLESCALKSSPVFYMGTPSQSPSQLPAPLLGGQRRDIEELSVCELARGSAAEPLNDLFSYFGHIGTLSVEHVPHWELPRSTFLRPLPELRVAHLVLNSSATAVATALCLELRAHTHMEAVRALTVDHLTTLTLKFACAAPNLEALTVLAVGVHAPLPPVQEVPEAPARLRRLAFIVALEFKETRHGFYSSTFRAVGAHIRALAGLNSHVDEVALEFRVHVHEELWLDLEFNLYDVLQRALSPYAEWQTIGEALDDYPSLQKLTLQVHNSEEPGRLCAIILKSAATRHLPQKYVSMLRIERD
ncbi:hypothetical protein PsYK624_167450 [Phanerochaete sordida]|uniref:Uncharacterized protein n=1 Tax=Phanerochaete sordida TaxID=48140 RepID=A0A9P3GT34_9APHY|nr:hypothetical protein PsYK624_167450 [Phanerochaete sordida]